MGVRSRLRAILAATLLSFAAPGRLPRRGPSLRRSVPRLQLGTWPRRIRCRSTSDVRAGRSPVLQVRTRRPLVRDAGRRRDRSRLQLRHVQLPGPGLILEFLKGRMTYWLSVSSLPARSARTSARTGPSRAGARAGPAASWSCRRASTSTPGPRTARTSTTTSSTTARRACATRLSDAVGGQLHASARTPARLTLRQQALRMTADYWPLYLALDIVLGPDAIAPSIAGARCSSPRSWRAACPR